jgi:hypothetical protein
MLGAESAEVQAEVEEYRKENADHSADASPNFDDGNDDDPEWLENKRVAVAKAYQSCVTVHWQRH